MRYHIGDRLTYKGRNGTVLKVIDYHTGIGYVRLLMDDVRVPYWVEFSMVEP